MRRPWLVRVLLLVALLTLTATAPARPLQVTFINPGFEDRGFWKAVTDTMSAAATQLDISLDVRYGNRQWPEMVQQAEAAIAARPRPDFLILVNEYQQGARLLERADEAGIPTLMLLNTLTAEQRAEHGDARGRRQHWIGSLTPDNEIAGYEMAASLVRAGRRAGLASDGTITLLTLAGDNNTPASMFRLDGLDRARGEFPVLTEARRMAVNWSREKAHRRTALWLAGDQPLEAVWAANDPIALGAIQALEEAGLTPGEDVVVAGLNWSAAAVREVRAGRMTLTHGGHFLAGAWAMVLLYDYANGNDFARPDPHVRFPMTAITAANAEAFAERVGDRDWSRVDFRAFTRTHNPQQSRYAFTLQRLLEATAP